MSRCGMSRGGTGHPPASPQHSKGEIVIGVELVELALTLELALEFKSELELELELELDRALLLVPSLLRSLSPPAMPPIAVVARMCTERTAPHESPPPP